MSMSDLDLSDEEHEENGEESNNREFNVDEFIRELAVDMEISEKEMNEFGRKIFFFNEPVSHDYEYLDHMLKMIPYEKSFDVYNLNLCKFDIRSQFLREEGNKHYAAKRFLQALCAYTECIGYAEIGTEDMGIGYANRSAVLFEKQYYKECLEDIDRALANSYPPAKREKLLARKEKATKLIPSTKTYCYHGPPPEIKNKHPKIPSAADCIEIKKNATFGRHVVATKDIKAGDVILVEKPYAKAVKHKLRSLYCSECMELCYNMIPCNQCAESFYCSPECRSKALDKFHRYECEVICNSPYVSIKDVRDNLLLRLTIQGIEEYKSLKKPKTDDVYRSDRYREIYELCTNREKMSNLECIRSVLWPAFFFKGLTQNTDILRKIGAKNGEIILKDLIIRNNLIITSNSNSINKFNTKKLSKFPGIGAGIYSFKSMFNHACNENLSVACYGDTVVLTAQRNIKKGEQCFVNYGRSFINSHRFSRQCKLAPYYFICNCAACIGGWPTRASLERGHYPTVNLVVSMERQYKQGGVKEENKKKFLEDCYQMLTSSCLLDEPEWGLNHVILKLLIRSCVFSLSNKDLTF